VCYSNSCKLAFRFFLKLKGLDYRSSLDSCNTYSHVNHRYIDRHRIYQEILLKKTSKYTNTHICVYLSIYGSTVLLLDLGRFFSFLILHKFDRTPWTGDEPVTRPLPTHRTTQTLNKRTQTSMTRVGFEPTIPAFQRAKTVHALDHAATLNGIYMHMQQENTPLNIGTFHRSRGGSSSPGLGQNFSLLRVVQTGSEAHPPFYQRGTRGSFPEGKFVGAWSWRLTPN
jgi:hypothetical protein